ncbi:hypothetical protein MetMK1DRAFT_00028590 [Metallosphaera yellowstonensis MK1]|uniref:Uncharacterized protein n=1 Tax=Metallosphaera yellowstonensis MK1 TaxID=671065 RepID=H2C8F0_9CREN|nr:hypothetical protein MetMK1DRAFT_00028590 [Metallosphaera yellowstonensis MK1]
MDVLLLNVVEGRSTSCFLCINPFIDADRITSIGDKSLGEPDFLRNIANKVLSPTTLDLKRLDDVRRLLAKAETKFKFSSSGGDPKRLVEYFRSPEFTELVLVLGVELTKKLLQEVINGYTDPEIKSAAKKVLEEIDGYKDLEESESLLMYKKF